MVDGLNVVSDGFDVRLAVARMPVRFPRVAFFALVLPIALSPGSGVACGYHDDVAVARGMLNWVYPDALHVIGSISTAVAERRLSLPNLSSPATSLLGSNYRTTVDSVEQLAERLRTAPGLAQGLSFSLVLVEPMLWIRFEVDQKELRAQVHVTGPHPGDLILVSGEAVIHEVARGRLTMGEARRLGLLRFYGVERQVGRFLDAYKDIGGNLLAADADKPRVPDRLELHEAREKLVR